MSVEAAAAWIGMFKDLALGGAAIATAAAAIKGIGAWQREMQGKAEFAAAQEMARCTYRLRGAIIRCRSPWFDVSEFPIDYNALSSSARDEAMAYGHIFNARLKPVTEALDAFMAAALDAEVLWGEPMREATNDLRACVGSLWNSIGSYIRNKGEGGEHFRADESYAKLVTNDVTANPGDDENPLTRRIDKAVKSIEDLLRPHLRRK